MWKSLLQFIVGIFKKDHTASSKRIGGIAMIFWALFAASYYIYQSFQGNCETNTYSKDLIEYIIATGAILLGGGTIAEAFSDRTKKATAKKTAKEESEEIGNAKPE